MLIFMDAVKAYTKLMRLKNSIATVSAVIVGALVAGVNIWVPEVICGCLVAFLIVAGGFAINDYYDRDIDIANKRDRPIPTGQINPGNAKTFGYLLLVSGIILSMLTLPFLSVFIAGTSAFLLDLYSRVLKRKYTLTGNFVVSYSTAITYIFGWSCLFSVLSEKIFLTLILMFAISLLVCLGREFIKSIQDVKGDSRYGVSNIAVRYGIRKASIFATISIISGIILTPLPFIFGIFKFSYLILMGIVGVVSIVLCISLVYKIQEIGEGKSLFDYAEKTKDRLLYLMALGILAFGAGLAV